MLVAAAIATAFGSEAQLCDVGGSRLLIAIKTSSRPVYAARLLQSLETWGLWCDGNLTAITDDADPAVNNELRSRYQRLSVVQVANLSQTGDYKNVGYPDEEHKQARRKAAFAAQIRRMRAAFRMFGSAPQAHNDYKDFLWFCYVDDDIYINPRRLGLELSAAPSPAQDAPGRWVADAGLMPHLARDTEQSKKLIQYSVGGWCMDHAAASAVNRRFTMSGDRLPRIGNDDVGFAKFLFGLGLQVTNSNAWFSAHSAPVRQDYGHGPFVNPNAGLAGRELGKVNMRGGPQLMDLVQRNILTQKNISSAFKCLRKDAFHTVPLELLAQTSFIDPLKQGKSLDFAELSRRLNQTTPTTDPSRWTLWHDFVKTQVIARIIRQSVSSNTVSLSQAPLWLSKTTSPAGSQVTKQSGVSTVTKQRNERTASAAAASFVLADAVYTIEDPVYIITLGDVPERRKSADRLRKSLNGSQQWPAVVDSDVESPVYKSLLSETVITDVPKSAVACALSHITLLQMFLRSDMETMIVFEDDAILTPNFAAKYAEFRMNLPHDFGYCPLFHHPRQDKARRRKQNQLSGKTNIIKNYRPWGTVGYLVSREGAASLLKFAIPIWFPIDEMFRHAVGKFSIKSYMPHDDIVLHSSFRRSNVQHMSKWDALAVLKNVENIGKNHLR